MTTSSSSFAEHVARTSVADYRPGSAQVQQPSRFPDVFPNLAIEEWAAMGLHHVAEDGLLCEDEDGIRRLEDGNGLSFTSNFASFSVSLRYLILLDTDINAHGIDYREWMIEGTQDPYWRIIFRTAFTSHEGWPRIMAIAGYRKTASRYAINCIPEMGLPMLGGDRSWY